MKNSLTSNPDTTDTTDTTEVNKPMTEAELKALFAPMLEGVFDKFKEYVDNSLTPLNDQVNGILETITTPQVETPQAASNDPLQARLEAMEQELQKARDKQAQDEKEKGQARLDKSLNDALNGYQGLINRPLLTKYFQGELSNVTERNGEFYTPDGKKVTELVANFFSTEEGKHFLPTNITSGAGVEKGQNKVKDGSTPKDDPWAMLSRTI